MRLRSSHGGRRLAVATAMGLGVLAATAGIAGGALTLKKKQAALPLAAGESGTATAKCKKGFRAVSGGFDSPGRADGGTNAGNYVMPFSSERTGRREWSTFGSQYFSGGGDLVTYVYCSDDLPRLKAKESTIVVDPDSNGTATATCPRGGEAVSGGFAPSDPDATFWTWASHRVGKRDWVVNSWNIAGDPQELTAFAYCAKEKVGLKEKSVATTGAADELVSATVKCKRRSRAVSGGFEGTWNDEPGEITEIAESRRKGKRGWEASTSAFSSTPPIPWETFVYCLKKDALG